MTMHANIDFYQIPWRFLEPESLLEPCTIILVVLKLTYHQNWFAIRMYLVQADSLDATWKMTDIDI